jgi:transcriptional regulator PpsR
MPDGFALLDVNGVVQRANKAFLDLVQVGSENGVIGRRIDHWLRRPGADMKALVAELRKQGEVRLFATTIQGDLGQRVEIEASAGVDAEGDIRFIGVVLRDVGTRIAAPANGAAPPALPALDNSPGKAPLKVLVRAAVAVVERHYVESALDLTEGNRTAAAELLGLSRQSLYSKLNRYGFDSGT